MSDFSADDLTCNAFLGGRLHLWQPKNGYRAGIDPVLLAAAVPAESGQSVLELGCGAGAAVLCLAARVPGLIMTGVELQPAYAKLAERNASENGAEMDVVCADLATPLGLTEVVEKIRQQGPVQVLVNNAGFGTLGAFVDTDFDSQQAMVDLHISATLRLCRAVIPYMKDAGGGSIINLSSLASFFPMRDVAVYAASKVFLNSFSESLQKEGAADNIQVQCLCPGYTHTDFHDRDSFAGFEKSAVPDAMF